MPDELSCCAKPKQLVTLNNMCRRFRSLEMSPCEPTDGSPDRPLFDPPEARSMVGTPSVPTLSGAPPRAGAVKDRRPPEAAAQKGRP